MRRGFWTAWWRLLTVQSAWNYERMTGIGLGYAAEPLLRDLRTADPARHAEAQVRAAEYFNSHPYLAGLALGALVRAEDEGASGEMVARLRTALTGPLGALGDQFFWAGLVPAVMGAAITAVSLGLPVGTVAAVVLGYAAFRLWTGYWSLATGLAAGPQISAALSRAWITRWAPRVGVAAGFLVGVALPLAARELLNRPGWRDAGVTLGTMGLGLLAGRLLGPRANSLRYGLMAIAAGILVWGLR